MTENAFMVELTEGEAYTFSIVGRGSSHPVFRRVLLSAGGAGVLRVADLDALFDLATASLTAGQQALVATQLSRWLLVPDSVEAPDGTRVMAAKGGGNWLREDWTHPSHLCETEWEVGAAGTNEATGAYGDPISADEWERRCCNPVYRPDVARVDIRVTGNIAFSSRAKIDPGSAAVAITGVPVAINPEAAITSVTFGDVVTGVPYQVTAGALSGSVATNDFLLVTSGPEAGSGCWAYDAGDAIVAEKIPNSSPVAWTDQYGITGSDLTTDDSITAMTLPIVDVTNLQIGVGAYGTPNDGPGAVGFVIFEKLHIRGVTGGYTGKLGQISGLSSGIVNAYALHCFFEKLACAIQMQTVGCKFDTFIPQNALAGITAYAGLIVGGGIYLANGATSFFHSACVIAGTGIVAANGAQINWRSGFAFNCIYVAPFSTQDKSSIRFDGHILGGKNNEAAIFQMGAGGDLYGVDGDGIYAETTATYSVLAEDDPYFNIISAGGLLGSHITDILGGLSGGDVGAVNLKHNVHLSPSPTGP